MRRTAKVNGISDFAQITRLHSPNFNKDYQNALSNNPKLFQKSIGMCTKIANAAAIQNSIARR
jgi:hypothetical protein